MRSEREAPRSRVLLVVPRPVRDLEGHVLVAYHLERAHGIDVRLTTGSDFERRLLEVAPDAVVLDYLGWDSQAESARVAKELGIAVFVLPTAGLFEHPDEYARAVGKYTGANELIDCYLAWGPASRQVLLSAGVLTAGQIDTVGNPRFDLYQPRYAALTARRERVLAGLGYSTLSAPLITWSTNTNNYNDRSRSLARVISQHEKHGGRDREDLVRGLRDERIQFEAHSEIVRTLALKHPEWNVLIKVHPFERVDPYRRLCAKIPNLRVAPDLPVRHILSHTAVLLQRGCTTATEAWMLGKAVIELEIGQFHQAWAPEAHRRGSDVARSLAEAEELISARLRGCPPPAVQTEARAAYLDQWYAGADGMASERCAAAIAARVQLVGADRPRRGRLEALVTKHRVALGTAEDARLVNRLKTLLGVSRSQTLRFWRTSFWRCPGGGAFSTADIQRLYRDYDRVLNGKSERRADEHGPDLSQAANR
jgi:surface carbohydrate biosynthesis protein